MGQCPNIGLLDQRESQTQPAGRNGATNRSSVLVTLANEQLIQGFSSYTQEGLGDLSRTEGVSRGHVLSERKGLMMCVSLVMQWVC